jgi:hypothetical protein
MFKMKYEDIKNMWEKNLSINPADIANESITVAVLHNRYHVIHDAEKLALVKAEDQLAKVRRERVDYYRRGCVNNDPNYPAASPVKWTKADLDIYLEGDEEYSQECLKVAQQRIKVDYLHAIIAQINTRNFQIQNHLKEKSFNAGLNS